MSRDGIDDLFGEIAKKMEAVDRQLRAEFTGRPAAEIEPVAVQRFSAIGLNFNGPMTEYAESIEQNKPFQFDLG